MACLKKFRIDQAELFKMMNEKVKIENDMIQLQIIEGHADIYMSRVSNFLYRTPFAYMRSSRSSLPHDLDLIEGPRRSELKIDSL